MGVNAEQNRTNTGLILPIVEVLSNLHGEGKRPEWQLNLNALPSAVR
jgi:hypothetical protein